MFLPLPVKASTGNDLRFARLYQEPLGLLLIGCFPGDCQERKRPINAFRERPNKVRKQPIKEEKRPIEVNGQFSGTLPWWKTAPLKGPIRRSMITPGSSPK